jgi:hypothetical protein
MRLRRLTRRIGAIFGTVAIGALLGFLVPTVVAEYTPQKPVQGGLVTVNASAPELPIARQFINAFVRNDQATLHALGADETAAVKANDLAAQVSKIGDPVLLGTAGAAGASVQAYASDATLNDGTQTILSWRLLTLSGRVVLILPPQALDSTP